MKRTLPDPIGSVLPHQPDEERVQAIWRGTQRQIERRRRNRLVAVTAAAAAVVVAVASGVALSTTDSSDAPRPPIGGPLRLEDGTALVPVEVIAAPRVVRFDDRSYVELATGSRLTPRGSDAHAVAFTLERGRGRFDVVPGGPRRWTIECDPVTVTVLGTAFVVERTDDAVRVEVERGRVEVAHPDGARVLGPGDSIRISRLRDEDPTAEVEPSTDSRVHAPVPVTLAPAVRAERTPPEPASPARALAEPTAWVELARAGRHREAYAALTTQAGSLQRETARGAPQELLLLADTARLAGHPADAVAPLERVLRDHSRADEAPLAAITLGNLELRRLAHPDRAARAYATALELGVPRAFDEDVRANLARARAASGDPAGAASAARDCLDRHPESAYAPELRVLVDAAP